MVLKDNSEIMVISNTESIETFMKLTKEEIIASNIHHMNALNTSIDIVNKFRNKFVPAVKVALQQFQVLNRKLDEQRSGKFVEAQVSFVLEAIKALKEELDGLKSSFKFQDEEVRGQTNIVVEKLYLAFWIFPNTINRNPVEEIR
jgi:hypothetical protein